jgi:hypothetical protein
VEKPMRPIAILNLTGELLPELAEYFSSRTIFVVNAEKSDEFHDWTHILTSGLEDFSSLNSSYEITKKDRSIISLTKVSDLQNFSINNGNLIIDNNWFRGSMGSFIMDKYFQSYGAISLSENYPSFSEIGSFNITNPFNTGDYLDRMVHKAFENGVEALTVKSYFDHLIMYATGLKNKGKAGLPFEVTYGIFEDIFAVQIHFFSKDLRLIDVSASLSSGISKKAEEYYLNIAVQSADFFDFSYMPQVNKIIITAMWTKDERITFENRGMMFASLNGGEPLAKYNNEGTTSSIIDSDKPIEDFSDKITIPETLSEVVTASLVKGFGVDPEKAILLKGSKEPKETSQLVKGANELTEDEAQLIKGGSLLEEIAQIVKGKFEDELDVTRLSGEGAEDDITKVSGGNPGEDEGSFKISGTKFDPTKDVTRVAGGKSGSDKSVMRIAGGKLDVDKVAFTIASKIDESTKEKNLKVRSLGNQLSQSIKTGLFDFAKGLGKEIDELDDSDLETFQLTKVPEILRNELIAATSQIVKEPATTESLSFEPQIKQVASKTESVIQLQTDLAQAKLENDKIKSHLKKLASELSIIRESRDQMAEIQLKAKQVPGEVFAQADDDETLRKQFLEKLQQQKDLSEMDLKNLSALLERESKLIAILREEELKSRKLELEASQKDTLFSQQLERAHRETKAKELMLIKSKEAFTKLVTRKENDINDLRARVEQLSKSSGNQSGAQLLHIKELEKQNQIYSKQIEVYKNKINALSANMQSSKSDDSFKEEARKLQMLNQLTKNQLDVAKKELEKLQAKAAHDSSQIIQLRLEKTKVEDMLKRAQNETRPQAAQVAAQGPKTDPEVRRLQSTNHMLENQIKEHTSKISSLEAKLSEQRHAKAAAKEDDTAKVKINQLETSLRKLTQDITEARNQLGESKKEINKLRQEKTSFQNQLDKFKKDADKAMGKKPGGKAA